MYNVTLRRVCKTIAAVEKQLVCLFLSDFNESRTFLTDFRKKKKKKSHTTDLVKNCLLGSELFHADWRTDMPKLIAAFCNSANAPENDHIPTTLTEQEMQQAPN
jgi:hypothetical protein